MGHEGAIAALDFGRPPGPVAPRTQPRCAGRRRRRRGVIAGAAKRVTAAEPRRPHPQARPDPMSRDRFVGIGRAGRQISTLPAEQRGKAELINADRRPRGVRGRPRSSGRRPRRGSRDLPERVDDRVEGQQRRGVPRLVVAHRLEHREFGPFAGGRRPALPSASRSCVSRSAVSSCGVAPMTWRAISEEDAWPSAQARTSCAKSLTLPSSSSRSIVTVEPHSFECALALASGPASRPCRGMSAASSSTRRL